MPVIKEFVKKHLSCAKQVIKDKHCIENSFISTTHQPLDTLQDCIKEQLNHQNKKTNMEREIFEQADSIRCTMENRVDFEKKSVFLKELSEGTSDILRCKRILVIGSGSSYHVAIGTRQLMEELVELPVFIELASDFLDREVPIFRNDVCILLSQSGETSSVLEACKYCIGRDALTISVTNNPESRLSKMTNFKVDINAGREIGITSTKTYTSQFAAMVLITLHLSFDKKPKYERIRRIIDELKSLPEKIEIVLQSKDKIQRIAREMNNENSILVMGRGYQQAQCLEGSFKFKEVSNIHSEGIHSGELKHGPLALIDDKIPIIMIIMRDPIYDKCFNALQQVKARHGQPILICEADDTETAKLVDEYIGIPKTIDCLAGILTVIPMQLLSLYLATTMNKNVDQPPALVKTVVEKHIPNNRSF